MENPVLFGVLDVEVQQQQGVYDNVCFGKALWLAESPSQEQLQCRECGELCFLIVQSKNQKNWQLIGFKDCLFIIKHDKFSLLSVSRRTKQPATQNICCSLPDSPQVRVGMESY